MINHLLATAPTAMFEIARLETPQQELGLIQPGGMGGNEKHLLPQVIRNLF